MAAVLALLLQVHVEGKHADVFGDRASAEKAAKEADEAGARFKDLFGEAPRRGAIVLTKEGLPAKDAARDKAYLARGAKWVWRWEAKRGPEPDRTMVHELAHLWLLFWADGSLPKITQYGSSLPDWFDEGVASLLEAAPYEAPMKGVLREAVPLADLLSLAHPDSKEKGRARAKDRGLFYLQSHSIVAFIADKYGAQAFKHVASTLKSGKRLEDALGAAGLPGKLEDFESAWRTWVAR